MICMKQNCLRYSEMAVQISEAQHVAGWIHVAKQLIGSWVIDQLTIDLLTILREMGRVIGDLRG